MRKWRTQWPGITPTRRELALLGRIERNGGLLVSYTRGEKRFACGNGADVQAVYYRPLNNRDFVKFCEHGWLKADPSAPGLFAASAAQRYLASLPR